MYIRKYEEGTIFEFDTLEDLRKFDSKYINNTESKILKNICKYFSVIKRILKTLHLLRRTSQTLFFFLNVKNGLASVRKIHDASVVSKWDFNIYEEAEKLIMVTGKNNSSTFDDFEELRTSITKLYDLVESDGKRGYVIMIVTLLTYL